MKMCFFITREEACEWANDVPTDCEEKEREEDAKATPSHLNSLRKSSLQPYHGKSSFGEGASDQEIRKFIFHHNVKCVVVHIFRHNFFKLTCYEFCRQVWMSFYPSLPGLDHTVVQDCDANQQAGQGPAEVAHVPAQAHNHFYIMIKRSY